MGSMSFGKYKLIAELGHGGMADVFLAVQAGPAGSGFRKLTVIKRLRQNLADEPEFVAMLVDEARIAARLNHPNVVQTNEVGSVGNHYFIAMEYLDGQPLHRIQHRSMQRVKAGGPPPLTADQQYLILMDTLAGLHHAHELADYDGTPLDIVHRDMTPQNVFVTYDGQVKVVDFGIARAAGRASETRQGVVKGKVRYMAPEQAVGLTVSRRADIFATTIMIWEAALGRRMWKDKDDLQIVHSLVAGDLPPMPRDADPTVPEAIDRICRKGLAMRPEDRYATAEELRLELEQYLAETGKLVETRRALAPMVSELFTDKRAEIRNIIEKQLASIDDAPSSVSLSDLASLPPDSTSSPSLTFDVRTSTKPSALVVLGVPNASLFPPKAEPTITEPTTEPKPKPKKLRSALFIAAATIAVVAGVSAWKQSSIAAPRVTQIADQITIRLAATPPTARASIDAKPFEALPIEIKVPRDDQAHKVRIEAEGYEPRTESVSFAQDARMTFDLIPHPTVATSASAKHAPTPAHAATVAAAPAQWRPAGPTKTADPKPTVEVKPAPSPPATAEPTAVAHPPHPAPTSSGKGRNLAIDNADPW